MLNTYPPRFSLPRAPGWSTLWAWRSFHPVPLRVLVGKLWFSQLPVLLSVYMLRSQTSVLATFIASAFQDEQPVGSHNVDFFRGSISQPTYALTFSSMLQLPYTREGASGLPCGFGQVGHLLPRSPLSCYNHFQRLFSRFLRLQALLAPAH